MKEQDQYGKITAETLKDAVDYIFKTKPRENAQKDIGVDYIDVFQDDETLSIKIGRLRTGKQGFLNLLDIEDFWVMRTLPIKFNGVVLNDEQTEQFWLQTESMRDGRKD